MKIWSETSLFSFNFWSGAKQTAEHLTLDDFNIIESILDDYYPDGINETELNDLFWFDEDTIAEWLGYSSFDELIESREEE